MTPQIDRRSDNSATFYCNSLPCAARRLTRGSPLFAASFLCRQRRRRRACQPQETSASRGRLSTADGDKTISWAMRRSQPSQPLSFWLCVCTDNKMETWPFLRSHAACLCPHSLFIGKKSDRWRMEARGPPTGARKRAQMDMEVGAHVI